MASMREYLFVIDGLTVSSFGETRAKARYKLWMSYSHYCGASFCEFLRRVKNG